VATVEGDDDVERLLGRGTCAGCYAFVNRAPQGRDRFAYTVANEPARFEFDVSEWTAKAEELRAFLRSSLEAFSELIERGPQQFVLLELRNKPQRR
jgi:hypothetical protein